ncbi:MAG: GNAT family N-acetyltransferase [Actinomycetota bacterium]
MSQWKQKDQLSGSERLAVLQLLNEIEGDLHRAPIDESARRMVLHGRPASYWLKESSEGITNFAVVFGSDPSIGEMAGGLLDPDLKDLVTAKFPHLHWWVRGEQVGSQGVPERTLLMMGAPLPAELLDINTDLVIRPFNAETDLDTWLGHNNAAFADHPEQGTWKRDDLIERLDEPWFDPSGFLVVLKGEEMVASVWTKILELNPAREGEIYVLWVASEHQGKGLGAVALTAGLRNLQLKGTKRAVLFVEETNDSATSLYESYGFKIERLDQLVLFER